MATLELLHLKPCQSGDLSFDADIAPSGIYTNWVNYFSRNWGLNKKADIWQIAF